MSQLGRMVLGLAAVAAMIVAASCSNPANPPPDNTAPTVSFYDLEVTLAGTVETREYYRENGENEGKPKYDQVSGSYYLYYITSSDLGDRWVIHTIILAPSSSIGSTVPYHALDSSGPTGTWNRTLLGATPPPTVARFAITGTLASGNVLTGAYDYSDAESDADASTYQWKKYANATDTSGGANCTGAGAGTLSYTVADDDSGQFLRLEVTPRDDSGSVGTPALSGAVKIESNTAPTVSFYDLQATGAGTTAVNGYYRENGSNESQPKYEQISGTYYLYYFTPSDWAASWAIHTEILEYDTYSIATVPYHAADLTGTWNRTTLGATPPPAVARVAVTGTPTAGNVLTGVYNYSDTEADADASTYQWKQYANATVTTGGTNCAGTGATSLSYTVDASDNGQFLRLEVTPRDARGAAGAPVQSGSVQIN